jgi:hypothetical protein
MKTRGSLMLLETLSVREASEADDKYSASVSPIYPISILNLLFGTYIMSVKNEKHNRFILNLYYLPVMLVSLVIFVIYQIIILPFCYMKVLCHKFALTINNPQGQGAKSTSSRFCYAMFFLLVGPIILVLDMIVDIKWFIKHMY